MAAELIKKKTYYYDLQNYTPFHKAIHGYSECVYQPCQQEPLVPAPKLWAEEISKRALLFP